MEILPSIDKTASLKRSIIRGYILNNNFGTTMIKSFSISDLKTIYQLYDSYFFNKELSKLLKDKNETLIFANNYKSEKNAGYYSFDNNVNIINISLFIIKNTFENGEKCIMGNGIKIYDRLGVLLNVFEHEIIHLYFHLKNYTQKIVSGKGKMYYSSHGKLFKELVFRFFGHTDVVHCFNNGDATDYIKKEDCYIGMDVSFKDIKGKVVKLNPKRAKVDTENIVYSVPYILLKKI